jgi:FKBP-type peptidyl-prolyl cis-trans isomerase (trigger factor)
MIEALLKHNDFEVPEALIAFYGQQQGHNGQMKDTEEKARESAEKRARINIILDKLAEENGVTVPEEDISGFLEREASREGVDPQKLRSYLVQTGKMEDIIAMFKRERAFAELEKRYLKRK